MEHEISGEKTEQNSKILSDYLEDIIDEVNEEMSIYLYIKPVKAIEHIQLNIELDKEGVKNVRK